MKKNILLWGMLLMLVSACGGDSAGGDDTLSKDYLNVTPNMELQGGGDTRDLTISANCSWTITKSADWITVNPTSGSNSQTVSVTAGKNDTGSDRIAVLTIKGGSLAAKTVTVTQKASGSSDNPDTPTEKTLSANASSLSYENTGGNQSFIITSNTSWSISCPSWCTLSTSSGTGNATITVTVGENPTKEQRSGQIVISGDGVNDVTINVSQKAGETASSEPNPGDNLPPS